MPPVGTGLRNVTVPCAIRPRRHASGGSGQLKGVGVLARIAGVDLPRDRRVEAALPLLYGVGWSLSREILAKANVAPDKRVRELTDDEVGRLREVIERDHKVEGDLRSEVQRNIKRLMDIGCYRGLRHRRGLPVRGQRTKTNARTRKGRPKTVGVARRKK